MPDLTRCRTPRPQPLKVAIIGAGAVAERLHLPALARSELAVATLVVDRSLDRAREVASRFGVDRVSDDFRDAVGQADAAFVGLPHQLHAPVACDLLDAGVHVLVEKPMALAPGDCDRMIAAAGQSGAVLAVGLLRRGAPSLRWVKRALEAGLVGPIERFELHEGSVYRWPVASPSAFLPPGGGVLADAGAHVLDLVLWWFGGWRTLAYRDDARGGVEADCLLELEMASGARGLVELSRTRDLANRCVIVGERGTIEVGTKTDSVVRVAWRDGVALEARGTADGQPPPQSLVELFEPQLVRFVGAITDGTPPAVGGVEGRSSIELMAACYGSRQPWTHPWDVAPAEFRELAGVSH